MTSVLFSIPAILIYSILFGVTMKLADCFNEHGFKWFKGDAIVFGVLFGLFGGLLIISNPFLTNLYLALLLVNVLRFRIDYFNHGIAGVMMFLSFLFVIKNFNWEHFLYLFIPFAVFGLVLNVIMPKIKTDSWLKKLFEYRFFYFLFALLFSISFHQWLVFVSMAIFQVSYDLTASYARKNKQYLETE